MLFTNSANIIFEMYNNAVMEKVNSANQIQQGKPKEYCPFCREESTDIRKHLKLLCKSRFELKKETSSSFIYNNGSVVCLRCLKIFDEHEWKNHSKNVSRDCKSKGMKSQTIKSLVEEHSISDQANNKIPATNKNQMASNTQRTEIMLPSLTLNILDSELLPELFCNHLRTSISVSLIQWLNTHKQLNKSILFKIFSKYCESISNNLTSIFPKTTFIQLYDANSKIKWTQILENPEQIFDKNIIKRKVQIFSINQQNNIFKAINKIIEIYPTSVFEKYQLIAKIKPKKERDKRPLLPQEYIIVVYTLISSKKKDLVHIGLDMMIIYQSGLRFPSDIPEVTKELKKYLLNSERSFSFKVLSKKIQKEFEVTLDNQLIQLLIKFEWQNFYRAPRFYERFYEVFPFPVYSLRRGFISFLFSYTLGNQKAVKILAGHRRQRTTAIYYANIQRAHHLQIKKLLKIPNLIVDYRTLSDCLSQLPQIPQFTQRIKLKQNWFSFTFYKLRQIGIDQSQINFLSQIVAFEEPQKIIVQNQSHLITKKLNAQSSSSQQQQQQQQITHDQIEQVFINETTFLRKNEKFDLTNIYKNIDKGLCQICNKMFKTGFQCQICTAQYDQHCVNLFCSCMQKNNRDQGLQIRNIKGWRKSKLKLKMPDNYISQSHEEVNQIRFLIHMRGFYYTNTAVCHQSIRTIDKKSLTKGKDYEQIILQSFNQYVSLRYFPPLKLRVTSMPNINGSGFGLYAKSQIQKDTFIGEYAADIFLNSQSIKVRRFDSIMMLQQGKSSKERISIGPINYCGYICLINQSTNPNCAAKTVIVNSCLRVIIYTVRKIQPNQELCYYYTSQEFLQKKEMSEQKLASTFFSESNKISKIDIGIKNVRSNCYISAVFQILKGLSNYLDLKKLNKSKNMLLNHFSQFIECKTTFDPSLLLNYLQSFNRQLPFSVGKQDDAQAFFLFFLNELRKQADVKFITGLDLQEVICRECSNITRRTFQFFDRGIPIDQQIIKINDQKEECLQNYDCEDCKKKTSAKITRTIVSYPKILTLYFIRFKSNKKENRSKYIPQQITFNNINYSKIYLILHKGQTKNSGHYTAVDSSSLTEYDDQSIKKISSVETKQIYMMFYKQL